MLEKQKEILDDFHLKIMHAKDQEKIALDAFDTVELSLQAGLWIEDVFSESGVSGGALVNIKQGRLYVGATQGWNDLDIERTRGAIVGVPLQAFEIASLPKKELTPLLEGQGLFAEVEFNRFVFNSENVRFAEFSLKSILVEEKECWAVLSYCLKKRQEIIANSPKQDKLGVSIDC